MFFGKNKKEVLIEKKAKTETLGKAEVAKVFYSVDGSVIYDLGVKISTEHFSSFNLYLVSFSFKNPLTNKDTCYREYSGELPNEKEALVHLKKIKNQIENGEMAMKIKDFIVNEYKEKSAGEELNELIKGLNGNINIIINIDKSELGDV